MKNNVLLYLWILIIFSSCTMGIQKEYFVTAPQVSHLTDSSKSNFTIGGNLSYAQVQFSNKVNDKYAFTGSISGGFRGQLGLDAGACYYKRKKNLYVEMNFGLGFTIVNSVIKEKPTDAFGSIGLAGGGYYNHNISGNYFKLFIQPFIGSVDEDGRLMGLGSRLSLVYVNYFDYNYFLDSYGGLNYQGHYEEDNVKYSNLFAFAAEPFIYVGKKKHYFMLGFCLIPAAMYSKTVVYNGTNSPSIDTYPHPVSRLVILHFGFIIRSKEKK